MVAEGPVSVNCPWEELLGQAAWLLPDDPDLVFQPGDAFVVSVQFVFVQFDPVVMGARQIEREFLDQHLEATYDGLPETLEPPVEGLFESPEPRAESPFHFLEIL